LNYAVPGSIWLIYAKMNLDGERDMYFNGCNWIVDNNTNSNIKFENINGDWSSHILCGGFGSDKESEKFYGDSTTSFSSSGYYIVPQEKEYYNEDGVILSLVFLSYSHCSVSAYLQAIRIA
jgi:hypothetical protein